MLLTIGISAVKSNEASLISYLSRLGTLGNVKFVVVVQGYEASQMYKCDWGMLLHSNTRGLSRSRNLVLENSHTEWVWFQDDDINLNLQELEGLIDALSTTDSDLIFTKIGSLENKNCLYKDYAFHKKHFKLNALKVSSIEIIVRVTRVRALGVRFDERLGLGTELPSCEENKFVYQLLDADIYPHYLDLVACYHTTNILNRNIDHKRRYLAKGYFLATVLPIYFCVPMFIRWLLVKNNDVSLFSRLKLLLKGYFGK